MAWITKIEFEFEKLLEIFPISLITIRLHIPQQNQMFHNFKSVVSWLKLLWTVNWTLSMKFRFQPKSCKSLFGHILYFHPEISTKPHFTILNMKFDVGIDWKIVQDLTNCEKLEKLQQLWEGCIVHLFPGTTHATLFVRHQQLPIHSSNVCAMCDIVCWVLNGVCGCELVTMSFYYVFVMWNVYMFLSNNQHGLSQWLSDVQLYRVTVCDDVLFVNNFFVRHSNSNTCHCSSSIANHLTLMDSMAPKQLKMHFQIYLVLCYTHSTTQHSSKYHTYSVKYNTFSTLH